MAGAGEGGGSVVVVGPGGVRRVASAAGVVGVVGVMGGGVANAPVMACGGNGAGRGVGGWARACTNGRGERPPLLSCAAPALNARCGVQPAADEPIPRRGAPSARPPSPCTVLRSRLTLLVAAAPPWPMLRMHAPCRAVPPAFLQLGKRSVRFKWVRPLGPISACIVGLCAVYIGKVDQKVRQPAAGPFGGARRQARWGAFCVGSGSGGLDWVWGSGVWTQASKAPGRH